MGLPKLDVTSANYNAICNIYDGDSNVPTLGGQRMYMPLLPSGRIELTNPYKIMPY